MARFAAAMLVCADLERSREFYRDVIGLHEASDDLPDSIQFRLADGSTLSLHAKSTLQTVRPGSMQLGFDVENVDEFVARAAARGVPVFQDPYDEPFGRAAIIGDPDGYPIQIASAPRKRREA